MYDSLAREIEYLILAGATHQDAPDLGSDVLDLMDEFVARYLALPNEQARHTLVLWCAHAWLMDVWEHTGRLLFISPEPGSGKTRSLNTVGQLVPRPDHVADLTTAALYHSIDEALELKGGRPTVLFDELDATFGTAEDGQRRNEEMRRLINAGHDRNETVSRKIGKRTRRFQVFAAMALAGKMMVDDVPATIRTRSIVIGMQRRLPGEKIERWTRREGEAEAEPIRWMLQCWAELVHSHAIDFVGVDHPVLPKGVEDRDADCWEPLLAVAELAGGLWPERARVAAVAAVAAAGTKASASSPGIELLADIRAVFGTPTRPAIHTTDLLSELATMDPRWRRLDGKRLATMLHGYGMVETNKDQRIGDRVTKGYRLQYFSDVWARYLPPATPATPATREGDDDDE